MSNDAINHTIKLTVEDGKYYLTMDFKGLSYLNKDVYKRQVFERSEEETDQMVYDLLCRSGLSDKMKNLPDGVRTYVYKNFVENGFEPSGGEGQKIALARALYKDSSIIILDEPTSALDPKAEAEIYKNFSELVYGKTAIFISHRMSSSKFCDQIAVFENGEMKEYGTHEQLMRQKGTYYTCLLYTSIPCRNSFSPFANRRANPIRQQSSPTVRCWTMKPFKSC